jgi:hypothetical protein
MESIAGDCAGGTGGNRRMAKLLAAGRDIDLSSGRVSGLLFIGFVVVELLRFIIYAPQVDAEVLCAAVAGFLLSGLAWSLAYNLLYRLDPNAFVFTLSSKSGFSMNGFTSLYFSFITLSTLGYGDIVPVAQVARMLAMVEAMFGMFYMALLVARLVSLYSSKAGLRMDTNRRE